MDERRQHTDEELRIPGLEHKTATEQNGVVATIVDDVGLCPSIQGGRRFRPPAPGRLPGRKGGELINR